MGMVAFAVKENTISRTLTPNCVVEVVERMDADASLFNAVAQPIVDAMVGSVREDWLPQNVSNGARLPDSRPDPSVQRQLREFINATNHRLSEIEKVNEWSRKVVVELQREVQELTRGMHGMQDQLVSMQSQVLSLQKGLAEEQRQTSDVVEIIWTMMFVAIVLLSLIIVMLLTYFFVRRQRVRHFRTDHDDLRTTLLASVERSVTSERRVEPRRDHDALRQPASVSVLNAPDRHPQPAAVDTTRPPHISAPVTNAVDAKLEQLKSTVDSEEAPSPPQPSPPATPPPPAPPVLTVVRFWPRHGMSPRTAERVRKLLELSVRAARRLGDGDAIDFSMVHSEAEALAELECFKARLNLGTAAPAAAAAGADEPALDAARSFFVLVVGVQRPNAGRWSSDAQREPDLPAALRKLAIVVQCADDGGHHDRHPVDEHGYLGCAYVTSQQLTAAENGRGAVPLKMLTKWAWE